MKRPKVKENKAIWHPNCLVGNSCTAAFSGRAPAECPADETARCVRRYPHAFYSLHSLSYRFYTIIYIFTIIFYQLRKVVQLSRQFFL